ncbi:unnamed protein product [Macrosiphum euphorbiae]|uniref:receptor protein-tyrosine kinase n=1 Tax=Macrosiphum euphorbiae TaxID=13131 RepID=A0AAV0VHF2_9HEMI|nr:unnamed protein product [Macrosiphum euphorbiae]
MYALMCLYLYCVALTAAAAIQNFWNEDEFCRNLKAIKIANLTNIRFNSLKPNTEYASRFRKLINGTTYHAADTQVHKTLDVGQNKGLVHTINISNFTVTSDSTLNTSLTWTPSNDMNCHYKIIYHSNCVSEGLTTRYVDVKESYAYTLNALILDRAYTLAIQPYYKFKKKSSITISGTKVEFIFSTPVCIEFNNFNLNSCPPGEPYDIKLSDKPSVGSTHKGRYDAQVSWKSPNTDGRGVDYFTVKLDKEAKNVSGKDYIIASPNTVKNASGVSEYVASFYDIPLGDRCFASVQAFSRIGQSHFFVVLLQRSINGTDSTTISPQLLFYPPWTTVTLLGLLVFSAALVVGRRLHRRAVAGSDCGNNKGGASADGYDMTVLKGLDDLDVLLDDDAITVSDVFLGHGHFGVVRKGTLKTADGRMCSVAVKSLRDRPSSRDLDEFLREILLMQKVGKHPNIVSMIGCCLDANRRCMLVVEYCQLGDLQTYLRKVSIKSWYANDFYVGRTNPAELTAAANSKVVESMQDTTGPPPPMVVFNNCYLYHGDENVFLTVDDLLRFASQVANGMLYLENNRVVHRDLAARNVLLSDHRTIKICDFGLSRDVYEQNLYQKSNRGDPLPVKWMALESLKYQLYTTQSDVWSFGVLLWEIMMLGGSPYPTISSSRIYEELRSGYRMPRPTLCCYSLYEVMLACWHANPANRPKFGTIKDTIDGIMENQYS